MTVQTEKYVPDVVARGVQGGYAHFAIGGKTWRVRFAPSGSAFVDRWTDLGWQAAAEIDDSDSAEDAALAAYDLLLA